MQDRGRGILAPDTYLRSGLALAEAIAVQRAEGTRVGGGSVAGQDGDARSIGEELGEEPDRPVRERGQDVNCATDRTGGRGDVERHTSIAGLQLSSGGSNVADVNATERGGTRGGERGGDTGHEGAAGERTGVGAGRGCSEEGRLSGQEGLGIEEGDAMSDGAGHQASLVDGGNNRVILQVFNKESRQPAALREGVGVVGSDGGGGLVY